MFFKRIVTANLAQYSYIIGDGGEAVIIDPQADIDKYLDIIHREGLKLTYILETHRNEDFLVGSRALSELTSSKVFVAAEDNLDYEYGDRINDNQKINIGDIEIKAIHTPGHTLGHMSYLLSLKGKPYMIFSGDALFFGGIGRTDFYGIDNLEKMTNLLYDSIFKRLLPLGDGIILSPAHGAGSACGASIEDRPFSTLGYEQKHNPYLQYKTKEDFVKNVAEVLPKPEYFTVMEQNNLKGHESIDCNPIIKVLNSKDIDIEKDTLIDLRNQRAFLAEHIENAIYIEREGLSSYLNWFVKTDKTITFITDNQESDYLNSLFLDMRRIGYKEELSFLANGMKEWNRNALDVVETKFILPNELRDKLNESVVLDIREPSEFSEIQPIEGSILIRLEEIADRFSELPKDKLIYVVCASGIRSTTVSSYLTQRGFDTSVLLGGINAWKNLD